MADTIFSGTGGSVPHAAPATEPAQGARITRAVQKRTRILLIGFGILFVYLAYAWIAFDVNGLIAKAQPERAVILATDSFAYKVHVVKDLRANEVDVAIEGERTSTYEAPPPCVEVDGTSAFVDLEGGYTVEIDGPSMRFTVPDYGTIEARVEGREIITILPPGPAPDWAKVNPRKLDARPTIGRRVQVTRTKIEVHRYFTGWENFFFPFRSELRTYSPGEILALVTTGDRLHEDQSNLAFVMEEFLDNPDWQHGRVFIALLETIMMAVLGTLTAVLFGLPLAFAAASNFNQSGPIRFLMRRLFDFLRGIDNLIWSLIFIRAFGLGPLTGALAIAFTDTGTLGKLFSEALENIDDKQVEGVRSTGAGRLQRYRYGVLPQILPVLTSQTLYYLESNTRSATVIGALGAGGIGLVLVETMRTSRDWENTLYIVLLTVIVVILMDSLSGWLRKRLISG